MEVFPCRAECNVQNYEDHMSHIPLHTILKCVYFTSEWDMGQMHFEIFEIGLYHTSLGHQQQ